MTALTKERPTPEIAGTLREIPVAADTIIYQGAMVAINASGYAVPASTATTLKIVGRAEETADNRNGAAGAINVTTKRGVFRYGNSASTDAIARKDAESTCYAVDDQTVALTNGTNTRSAAGIIHDVDAQGVWVRF